MTDCRYFDSVDICKYRTDWMECRQKTTLPSSIVVKPQVTQIEVFEATEVDIGFFQEGGRSCSHFVCSVLSVSALTLLVGRQEEHSVCKV